MVILRGAEAEVRIMEDRVIKKRREKRYRIRELDEVIRKKRTRMEARIISQARRAGVPTPVIYDVEDDTIVMERIRGELLRNCINEGLSRSVGENVAILHENRIIHGDLTPKNIIVSGSRLYFIDFGLAFFDERIEPMGMDLHVYFESLRADFDNHLELRLAFLEGYSRFRKYPQVVRRVEDIEERGRYRVGSP